MRKLSNSMLVIMVMFFSASLLAQTPDQQEIISDAEMAREAFIQEDADMQLLFDEAIGYVIFPNVGKGAYIVGGASGNGAVYENDQLIGMADLKQVDVGLQLGGQAFREVIFFQSQAALDRFKEGNFELTGNASAVALDKGAARSVDFSDGVAVITMPKAGAMIEISVGGQKFGFEEL